MALFVVPGLHGPEPDHWEMHWQAQFAGAEPMEQSNWDAPDIDTWLAILATLRGAAFVDQLQNPPMPARPLTKASANPQAAA